MDSMEMMWELSRLDPRVYGLSMLGFGMAFGILWYLDHLTHLRIWREDITDGELRTHRMILFASYGLMASLALMAWSPWAALPLFIGCWVTRTLHEFMDEIHWHLPRCSERETLIHLGMWISIHGGTAVTFIWGFFLRFKGFGELPVWVHLSYAAIFAAYSWIGHHELFGYLDRGPVRRSATGAAT